MYSFLGIWQSAWRACSEEVCQSVALYFLTFVITQTLRFNLRNSKLSIAVTEKRGQFCRHGKRSHERQLLVLCTLNTLRNLHHLQWFYTVKPCHLIAHILPALSFRKEIFSFFHCYYVTWSLGTKHEGFRQLKKEILQKI